MAEDQPTGVPATIRPCQCCRRHRPRPVLSHVHHVVPKSWGGSDEAENLIPLCPTTHDNVHVILRSFLRAGGVLPRRKHWPKYAYEIALRGWVSR